MLHLIWSKETAGEEVKSVRSRLIECYRLLYLSEDHSLSEKESINSMTRNLITLTYSATFADLTSLEAILMAMMSMNYIPESVISKLWQIYGSTKHEIPIIQRRGAIIILGMLSKSSKKIVEDNIDLLLRIGLGSHGKVLQKR